MDGEGLHQRQVAFKDELARTKERLSRVQNLDKKVKDQREAFQGLTDYGGAGDYNDDDDAPGWPFYLGLFLLLFVMAFMGVAFFAPEWFESEPHESFEDEY